MKTLLLALLVASPAVASWVRHGGGPAPARPEIRPISYPASASGTGSVTRVPVEVLSKGSAPQWVYIQVPGQAVPEPGMISLLALTSLFLVFRRRRP